MATVDIVMSVYNGERFLKEMLDSIAAQTFTDWHLVIRNNGSTDSTSAIINSFISEFTNKVTLIDSPTNEKFIPLSFGDALNHAKSQYLMYADGDDVWLADKVKMAVESITQAEKSYGVETPILVHTDLILVDEKLSVISNSMWKSQSLDPKRNSLNQVIMHSNACGNTFIFNRALYNLITPIPHGCIMHDYWTTCIAACFGKIVAIPSGSILYRQHGANSCGAYALNVASIIGKLKNINRIKKSLLDKYRFAEIFLLRFRGRLSSNQILMLEALSSFDRISWFSRRLKLIQYSLYQNSIIRNAGLFILC